MSVGRQSPASLGWISGAAHSGQTSGWGKRFASGQPSSSAASVVVSRRRMRASKSSSIASRCYPDTVGLMRGEQQKRLHGSPTREGAIVGPLVLVVVHGSVVPPVADTAE